MEKGKTVKNCKILLRIKGLSVKFSIYQKQLPGGVLQNSLSNIAMQS